MNADKNINDELTDVINENINKINDIDGTKISSGTKFSNETKRLNETKLSDGTKISDETKIPDEHSAALKKEKAPAKKTRTSKPKKAEPQQEERSIEELFAELDGIIGKLENGDISLEDSFHYYEAGMKLVKHCSGKIDKVEKQIQVLNESAVEE